MGEASDFLADSHPRLPADWNWSLFTDVMDIEGGTQPPASEFVDDARPGYVRLVQIRDFDSDAHLTYIPDSKKWRKCEKRDVLIARYGAALGRICRGLSGAYNVALAKVVPTEHVEIDFVNYLLRSHWFQAPLLASGGRSAQAGFNKGTLAVIPLPIPPLAEQRAIAGVLGALDDKIAQNRRTAQALERLARAIFRAWFVDFEPVKAKAEGATFFPSMSHSAFVALPNRFVDSEIGPVPEGWQVKAIGDVVTVKGGGTPSTKNPAYWDGGIHCWATPKDMSRLSHPVLLDTERRITGAGIESISSGILPIGTVLMSSRAPVGYLAISGVPTAINQGFIAMICDGSVPPVYVLNWAVTSMDTIKAHASGTTFAEISKKNFRPLPIVQPTSEVIAAYQQIAEPLFELLTACIREDERLAGMRDYLLPKLLSGEVHVSRAETQIEDAVACP